MQGSLTRLQMFAKALGAIARTYRKLESRGLLSPHVMFRPYSGPNRAEMRRRESNARKFIRAANRFAEAKKRWLDSLEVEMAAA